MGDRSNDRSAGTRTQVEDGGRVVAQQLVGSRYGGRAGAGTEAAGGRPAAVLSGGDRPPGDSCQDARVAPFPWCTQEVDDGDR